MGDEVESDSCEYEGDLVDCIDSRQHRYSITGEDSDDLDSVCEEDSDDEDYVDEGGDSEWEAHRTAQQSYNGAPNVAGQCSTTKVGGQL